MIHCIQEETHFCFYLAHSNSITKPSLASKFEYLSDTEIACQLLGGSYDIPDDIDNATEEILNKTSRLGIELQTGNGEKVTVTPNNLK